MEVRLDGGFGVEVKRDILGVKGLDALLKKEGLVVFRDVKLEPSDEEAVMKRLPWDNMAKMKDLSGPYNAAGTGIIERRNAKGEIVGCARWKLPDFPMIQIQGSGEMVNHYKVADGELISKWSTREFHTDGPHDTPKCTYPPVATSMYCIETPNTGGQTLFADSRRAFCNLDDETKILALSLDVIYDHRFRPMLEDGCRAIPISNDKTMVDDEKTPITNRWPLVILDRDSQPALYLGPAFSRCLIERSSGKRWNAEESQAFLGKLMRIATTNVYEHTWKKNDFIIWDNRRSVHSATPSDMYKGQRRIIHRIRMSSKEPIVPAAHACTAVQLDLYSRLWASQQLLASGFFEFLFEFLFAQKEHSTTFNLASQTHARTWLLWILFLSIMTLGASSSISFLRFAHIVNFILHAIKLPMVWDYEIWDGLTDLSIIFMSPVDAAPLIRWQMITFYTATAIYKLTKSFLDPRLSCAPIFVFSLLDSMIPTSIQPSSLILQFFNTTAPFLTVCVEAAIPFCLTYFPRFGICFALFFHFLIAVTPPPNNAGGFSVSVAVRYALFFALGMKLRTSSKLLLLFAPILIAVAFILGRARGNDWALPVYVGISIALLSQLFSCHHFFNSKNKIIFNKNKISWLRLLIKSLTILYTLLPILGLQDMMAPTMFANLRVFTPSNHVLLPTNLLQHHDIVRVDFVNSLAFNDVHPNRADHIFSDRLSSWLKVGGHSGLQFAPYVKRAINITLHSNLPEAFLPYLLPDLELRRLLAEARAHSQDFSLIYTKLPSGDQVHYHAMNNSCSILSSTSSSYITCPSDELPFAPPLSFWQDKFLLFFSIPIAPDALFPNATEIGCLC